MSLIKNYKSDFFKNLGCLFMLGLFNIIFTSCSLFDFMGSKDNANGPSIKSTANFIIDEVKGKVVSTSTNGLPEEVMLSYTACFRDIIYPDNTLPNSLFKIYFFENHHTKKDEEIKCIESDFFSFSPNTSPPSCIQMRTDSNGCINWTEVYPYRPINQSAWFKYSRAFEGTGVNSGMEVIDMAMNPWLSKYNPGSSASILQLVDLRYHSNISKNKNWKFIELSKADIPQCQKASEDENLSTCAYKLRSLFSAISYFEQQIGKIPQIWFDVVKSNISLESIESINIKNEDPSNGRIKILEQFNICHENKKENCDNPGRFFKVQLQIPLHIKVKNYKGEDELIPLTRGNYSIKPYLFLQTEKHENILLHKDIEDFIPGDLVETSQQEYHLKAEFYLHIPYEHYNLKAFLAVKVISNKTNKTHFIPFEGVFQFPNNLKSVIGSQELDNLQDTVLNFYKENHGSGTSLIETKYKLSYDPKKIINLEGFKKAGWDVKLKRLRFSEISRKDCPTPVKRTVRYVGEVCIVDPLKDTAVVPNTSIKIQRQNIISSNDGFFMDGEVTDIKTNNKIDFELFDIDGTLFDIDGTPRTIENKNIPADQTYISDTSGCLQWVDEISHKWYDRQKYFLRKMIFSKEEWGFKGERVLAINPWHYGFVFFQDTTQLGPGSIRTQSTGLMKPKVLLHDFRTLFPELIYSVDRFLGISLFQNLLFLFKMRIDRTDDVAIGQGSQRTAAMDARRGYYFLRLILIKSHTEEDGGQGNQVVNADVYKNHIYNTIQSWNVNEGTKTVGRNTQGQTGQMINTNLDYITHFDTYVQVRDSTINAYINFLYSVEQFIFIGSNSRVLVQLTPTDPKYYVYKQPNSCEVDPEKSIFLPFIDHDLVTPVFIAPFVPSDQRNWNILRVLKENLNLDLDLSSKKKIDTLDVGPEEIESYININKETGQNHKIITRMQTSLLSSNRSDTWTQKTINNIPDIKFKLETFINQIVKFFTTALNNNSDVHSLLSSFNDNKNAVRELAHEIRSYASEIYNNIGDKSSKEYHFFEELTKLSHDILSTLNNTTHEDDRLALTDLYNRIKNTFDKLENILDIPPESDIQLLTKKENPEKEWFHEEINFPKESSEWSGFNRDLFAKDEGLKIISMDDAEATDNFIKDLNDIATLHNEHHNNYNYQNHHNKPEAESTSHIEGNQAKEEYTMAEHKQHADDYHQYQTEFWKNFELTNNDDYYTVAQKIKNMHLPNMTKPWLENILTNGIHTGTIKTPEVMTFVHSLCGFWFEKFYEKYLEQKQLDIIFQKHMDHYNYYKSTLDFLKNEEPTKQHYDLLQAMEEYNLTKMDEHLLIVENPFLIRNVEDTSPLEQIINNIFDSVLTENQTNKPQDTHTTQDTVLSSLYKNQRKSYEQALYISSILGFNLDPTSILKKHRHPYFTCLANPFNFFHIEKKIIVGDIGKDYSDLSYKYGYTKSINLQRAFDYAYSASWSANRSFSTSLGTGFTVLSGLGDIRGKFINPLTLINPVASFSGIKLSSDWNTSRSEGDSNRRQQSLRFADESLYLQLNHSILSIRLTQFRHCLVVRAKNHAFEGYEEVWQNESIDKNFIYQIPYIKSGLMICSENIDEKTLDTPYLIEEDYFYLYQLIPGDRGQFQNPLNMRNRPFVISLRGMTEMEKMIFLIHSHVEADKMYGVEDYNPHGKFTNPFNRESKPALGAKQAIIRAKLWNKTGFYPGVYSVKYDNEHYFFKNPIEYDKNSFERLGEWLYNNNPMPAWSIDGESTQSVFDRAN